jgi:hypothetical protein
MPQPVPWGGIEGSRQADNGQDEDREVHRTGEMRTNAIMAEQLPLGLRPLSPLLPAIASLCPSFSGPRCTDRSQDHLGNQCVATCFHEDMGKVHLGARLPRFKSQLQLCANSSRALSRPSANSSSFIITVHHTDPLIPISPATNQVYME